MTKLVCTLFISDEYMAAYQRYAGSQKFPSSWLCSQHTINLPVHTSIATDKRERIVQAVKGLTAAR